MQTMSSIPLVSEIKIAVTVAVAVIVAVTVKAPDPLPLLSLIPFVPEIEIAVAVAVAVVVAVAVEAPDLLPLAVQGVLLNHPSRCPVYPPSHLVPFHSNHHFGVKTAVLLGPPTLLLLLVLH
jgi:hypothetical protein